MSDGLKASIIIRTFNSERTLDQVLQSVEKQSFKEYELVIVDSGSTDRTLQIVEGYPHTFVDYSDKKFSYSGSLNAGCEAAQGECLIFLSHHCIPLHEEWLGNMVEAMEKNRQLAGAWGPLLFDPKSYQVGRKGIETMNLDEFYQRPNQGLQNPNSIIRRELWREHRFSGDVDRCEDQEWAHHFMLQGYETGMVHGSPVLYTPEFGFYEYAASTYKNLRTLNRLFGYVPAISTKELLRRSVRLLGAALLKERDTYPSGLAISGMVGRWVAYRSITEGKVKLLVEDRDKIRRKAEAKMRTTLRGVKRRTDLARLALNGSLKIFPSQLTPDGTVEPSQKTRFFLVGEMRSGTSWLQKTLDTHPEVFCKGEGTFFGRDQEKEEIPVYDGPSPSLHNALAANESFQIWHSLLWNGWARGDAEKDLGEIVRMTIDYYLAKDSAATGKPIVGDKSPLHTDYVDEIHRFYPEAKVIHIIRDGRDVAVSLMNHFWRMAKDNGGIFDLDSEELTKRDAYLADPKSFIESGNSIFTEERLRQMAVRWNRRVTKAPSDGTALFGASYYQLRYEDLLEEPEAHLKALLGLLGARTDDALVRFCVEQNRFEKLAKRTKGDEDADSFFRKGVAGDWREIFTDRDREIYESVAGEALKSLGYFLD